MLAPDQPLNKANDLNYTPGMTRDAYLQVESYMAKNAGAFVFGVEDGLVACAMVLIMRSATAGDELGIGYGYEFWSKHAEMTRYAASLSDTEVSDLKNLLAHYF